MKPLYWDDMRVSLARATAGGDPPTWSVFRNGVYAQSFADGAVNSLMFDVQLPHSWAGTDLAPHLHWSPGASTNTGAVRWGLEYTWQNINGAFPATTTIYIAPTGSGTAYQHQMASFANLTAAGFGLSSLLLCRLFRDGANGADTFAASAFALSLDFHFQTRQLGSVDA